jgi:hypothetical protein
MAINVIYLAKQSKFPGFFVFHIPISNFFPPFHSLLLLEAIILHLRPRLTYNGKANFGKGTKGLEPVPGASSV